MFRRLTVSALFALGLLAVVGFAQPLATFIQDQPQKKDVPKKPADPLDGLIAAALANDPDVKMAHAKLQLADAELAKARQSITLKVMGLQGSIQEQKRSVAAIAARVEIVARMAQGNTVPQSELLEARDKLESAKAKLAQLETELKLLTSVAIHITGEVGKTEIDVRIAARDELGQPMTMGSWLAKRDRLQTSPVGPISDRIRAALDKPVKLGPKDAKVTIEQALEIFKKDAGLDVPVRVYVKLTPIVSLGEELSVGAWLQLFADGTQDSRILVREYGLLVTHANMNPPEGMSIFDFWKQKSEKSPK